jgi:hypothetical protein
VRQRDPGSNRRGWHEARTHTGHMRHLFVFSLLLASVAGGQDSITRPSVVADSTARRIALSAVSGGAVRSDRLDTVAGRPAYRFVIVTPSTPTGAVVVIDATDGNVLSVLDARHNASAQRSHEDSLINRESSLKDTTVMPPNTLHDTAAAHRDTTPLHKSRADTTPRPPASPPNR